MKFKLAIFASGNGSNALKILEYFQKHESISVELILTNNKNAGVIQHAQDFNTPVEIISTKDLETSECMSSLLSKYRIDYIILAGFLKKIPPYLIHLYPDKILNIHPSLLPKYGGKGMYGHHVHWAVWQNHDPISGITIHFVDEHYDEGNIIFQKTCDITSCKNADEIARNVLDLEWEYYAPIIEKTILANAKI